MRYRVYILDDYGHVAVSLESRFYSDIEALRQHLKSLNKFFGKELNYMIADENDEAQHVYNTESDTFLSIPCFYSNFTQPDIVSC